MWHRPASLTVILKSVVRESFVDEFMNAFGLRGVYEDAWPAALCLEDEDRSLETREDDECTHEPCAGVRVLGILQRFRRGRDVNATTATTTPVESYALGDVRSLFRDGTFEDVLARHPIDAESFDHMALFWFLSGHPDLHGGNILYHSDGRMSCIDADMTFDTSPGCLMGPLQIPCVFGFVQGFSIPCIFQTKVEPGRHDECPTFVEADRPFLRTSLDLVRSWDAARAIDTYLSNPSVIRDTCESLRVDAELCPAITSIFGHHAESMFRLRLRTLQDVITPDRTVREVYRAFLPLYLYRVLQTNVSEFFEPEQFKFREVY